MITIRILSAAAALVLGLAAPSASFAQPHHMSGSGVRVGSGGVHVGGGGARVGSGWHGHHGGHGGGYHRHGGRGFIPGAIAGALIGGAIASQGYGYYSGPAYNAAPVYYDDQYSDDDVAVVAPAPANDDGVAYCMQTYRSYNPQTGTYLGYDGLQHPCP